MKITKTHLRQIIKEELSKAMEKDLDNKLADLGRKLGPNHHIIKGEEYGEEELEKLSQLVDAHLPMGMRDDEAIKKFINIAAFYGFVWDPDETGAYYSMTDGVSDDLIRYRAEKGKK